MDKDEIREIVRETIRELQQIGILKSQTEFAFAEATAILNAYYADGETDPVITKALKDIESDTYYKTIPLFFDYGYTLEQIAEVFDVDVTTISRNKKRLCLAIYNSIQ